MGTANIDKETFTDDAKEKPLDTSLYGVREALKRLERVARVIGQATQESLARRAYAHVQIDPDDNSKELFSMILTERFRSTIVPGLVDLISNACIQRHIRIRYDRSRAVKELPRPEIAAQTPAVPPIALNNIKTPNQEGKMPLSPTADNSPLSQIDPSPDDHSTPPTLDASKFRRDYQDTTSASSVGKTSSTISEAGNADYPRPPQISKDQAEADCPICFKTFPFDEFEGNQWR